MSEQIVTLITGSVGNLQGSMKVSKSLLDPCRMPEGGVRLLKEIVDRKETKNNIKLQKRAKAKWMWCMVKKGMAFTLKPWQYINSKRQFNHSKMTKGANFVSHVVYASQWDDQGNIEKYDKVSWDYVQCDLCVCQLLIFLFLLFCFFLV